MRERVGLWRHCRGEGEGLDKMDSHGIQANGGQIEWWPG